MPPSGKLPDETIALLKAWIEEGAVWPVKEAAAPHDEPLRMVSSGGLAWNPCPARVEHELQWVAPQPEPTTLRALWSRVWLDLRQVVSG
jgi:hypothetical protein